MPRTCPSMRLTRFTSAALSRRATGCGCAAALRDDVIARIFNRTAKLARVGALRIVRYGGGARAERHLHVLHTRHGLQHARDARDATAARHALDVHRDRFHSYALSFMTCVAAAASA